MQLLSFDVPRTPNKL